MDKQLENHHAARIFERLDEADQTYALIESPYFAAVRALIPHALTGKTGDHIALSFAICAAVTEYLREQIEEIVAADAPADYTKEEAELDNLRSWAEAEGKDIWA